MRVTITGSGTPIPTPDRAGPGVLVTYGETHLQFDAGRGTLGRLVAAGSSAGELTALFVTHHHSDHMVGIDDLLLTRWVMDNDDALPPVDYVAPDGPAIRYAAALSERWSEDLAVRRSHAGRSGDPWVNLIGFDPGDGMVEVWTSGPVRVLAQRVRHDPVRPAVGYRIETPDGIVTVSGDTRVCDEMVALAEGADVVVYEAILATDYVRAPERSFILDYHADVRLVGAQVAALGIERLILTHLVPPPNTAVERQAFVDEVRAGGYEGELIVANDLDYLDIG